MEEIKGNSNQLLFRCLKEHGTLRPMEQLGKGLGQRQIKHIYKLFT